jgi:hypothetical protein
MWLWSANPVEAAIDERSSSPAVIRSSAACTRRRARYCEIVMPVARRKTLVRWNGDIATCRASSTSVMPAGATCSSSQVSRTTRRWVAAVDGRA